MLGKIATILFIILAVFCALDAMGVLSPTPDVCMEDQPCWSCAEMGNGVCGPTPTGFNIPVLGDALTSN